MEDLREYLNRNFLSKPRVQMLQQGYWAQAVSLAPLLPLSYRAELFGIIWNNQPKFQQLFLELCQALEALGNPAEADCPLEACCRARPASSTWPCWPGWGPTVRKAA